MTYQYYQFFGNITNYFQFYNFCNLHIYMIIIKNITNITNLLELLGIHRKYNINREKSKREYIERYIYSVRSIRKKIGNIGNNLYNSFILMIII